MGGAAREGFQANAATGPAKIRLLESEARRPSKPLTADYVPEYRNTKLAVRFSYPDIFPDILSG